MILRAVAFSDIAGWDEDAHDAAFAAFKAGARAIAVTPPKTRGLGIDGAALQHAALAALALDPRSRREARAFFESRFTPHLVEANGFVTGYYEPEIEASLVRTERFQVPLYRRPRDLVDVSEANRPAGWDPEIRFGRATGEGVVPYCDRAAIEEGALAGRGLELAWLEDAVDAFFVHVQGSARLRLPNSATLRVGFAAKSGHAYTSVGRLAVERGLLTREAADKDGLEAWLKANREAGRALMRENRSFIFFRDTGQGETEGPLGAAGVPLAAGRSLAVDRTLHTFHTPVWVAAPELSDREGPDAGFRRLMIAHDTGSAIVGPARGDIFVGSGAAAGSSAGRIRHAATMIALVPAEGV